MRFLTPDQEAALFAVLPPRYHPLVTVALHTGMRKGELLRLTWRRDQPYRGTIKVKVTKADEPRHGPMNSIVQTIMAALKESSQRGARTSVPGPIPGKGIYPGRQSGWLGPVPIS